MQKAVVSRRAVIAGTGVGAFCLLADAAEAAAIKPDRAPSVAEALAILVDALKEERGGEWWSLVNYEAGVVAVSLSS